MIVALVLDLAHVVSLSSKYSSGAVGPFHEIPVVIALQK